jgi:hypothetical protein
MVVFAAQHYAKQLVLAAGKRGHSARCISEAVHGGSFRLGGSAAILHDRR